MTTKKATLKQVLAAQAKVDKLRDALCEAQSKRSELVDACPLFKRPSWGEKHTFYTQIGCVPHRVELDHYGTVRVTELDFQ